MSVKEIADDTYSTLSNVGFRLVCSTAFYPIEYAKFLIQIGHEPLPYYYSKTLFGKVKPALPNVFQYVKYIKGVDGLSGCYRGIGPKLTGHLLSTMAAASIAKHFKPVGNYNADEDELSNEEKIEHLRFTLSRDVILRTVTVVVSQPFFVISSRMMAQFVGGEQYYNSFFGSVVEIYKEQGIVGFFAGFFPRWFGDIITLLISSIVIFGVNNYMIQDRELKAYTTPTIQYISNTLTYPFTVVASCMAVNNCNLQAGIPPNMPIYKSWISCWFHLSKTGQLNRGSSLLFRYYNGPTKHFAVS